MRNNNTENNNTYLTGKETCPWDLAAKYQIHVTADVSYALRQYIYVTDKNSAQDFLNNNGSSLALEIGRFWESRVTIDDNDTYNIIGKVPYVTRELFKN